MEPLMTLREYAEKARAFASTWNYSVAPAWWLAYVVSKLAGEAGEVAEKFGKAIRDDQYPQLALTPARREAMKLELGDTLWYLTATAEALGFTLEEVAEANLAKLTDRRARGVLHGDGDAR